MLSEPSPYPSIEKKKNYSKFEGSPLSHHLRPQSNPSTSKKIIPTQAHQSLREDYKKIFLPLLIDIFELRQMLETHKLLRESPQFRSFGKVSKSPQEIVERLTEIQREIEESQRWCDGVILQIAKGINEAKETLEFLKLKEPLEEKEEAKQPNFWKRLLGKLQRLTCKKK